LRNIKFVLICKIISK
jgi:hypothetical protein